MLICEERNDIVPICPHCQTALDRIQCRRLSSVFGKRYVFFCPHCKKVLGVSHRKGFWMG
jgi:glutaredoxin